ncbi:MAG: hypothetical protein R3F14_23935 [Polyangiaceae bacterium]
MSTAAFTVGGAALAAGVLTLVSEPGCNGAINDEAEFDDWRSRGVCQWALLNAEIEVSIPLNLRAPMAPKYQDSYQAAGLLAVVDWHLAVVAADDEDLIGGRG